MRPPHAWAVLLLGVGVLVAMVLLALPPAPLPAPTYGCMPIDTGELYVQHAYACTDGTRVLTFSDVTQRDEYARVAEGFGVTIIDRGEAWIRVRPL